MYARKRCRRILKDGTINELFQKIRNKLSYAREDLEEDPDRSIESIPFHAMENLLKKVRETICLEAAQLSYSGDNGQLTELSKLFSTWNINISKEIDALRQELSVFKEYVSRKDYKKPDEAIIRHLLWLLYAENDITCIKLRGRAIADNITGPLILEPHRLVFFGQEHRPEWDEFLRGHGNRGEIAYLPHCGNTVDQITSCLKRTAAQQRSGCVIDITGADEQLVIAAQRVADTNTKVSLIHCTPDGHVENIQRFPTAAAYTLNTTIAADEIFSLHGASKHPSGNRYMEHLEDMVPTLWDFFQEFRSDWNEITAFFASRCSASPELHIYNIQINDSTDWKSYTHVVDKAKWNTLELGAAFSKLADNGIIRDLETEAYLKGRLHISFLYPSAVGSFGNDFFCNTLDEFFDKKIHSIYVPMHCSIYRKSCGITVDISSGCFVEVSDKNNLDFSDCRYQYHTQRIPYARVLPALKWLEEQRLITQLRVSGNLTKLPVSIRFGYADPALRTCLSTAGNVLELFIWMQAKDTHFFDNVQPNLSFTWREGIDNELDVIVTKGLTSLIISAKTARFNREHLYEIKYLTEHFSLNSKPVIVYSSSQGALSANAVGEMHAVKQRAKAMGIYLIDLNELSEQNESLGDRLAAIAGDTAFL